MDFEAVKRQARIAGFRPVDLGATLSTSLVAQVNHVESRNVIARLPGARRPDETVMFSGHWDAYGSGPADANGDTIRNGAHDDALGIAGLLEIARLARAGPRPQRTLLFAAWTAEERGLLGSEYYAANPLYPAATDGREPDARHAAIGRPVARRDPDRPGAERPRGPARRGTPPGRAAASPPTRSPSAASSTAPTISRSPSAACRCCC